jgi:hypothetical protein
VLLFVLFGLISGLGMSDFDKWCEKYWEENNNFPSADEAWNHQQQKIDAVLKFIDGYNSEDIENDVVLKDCINEIQELLK